MFPNDDFKDIFRILTPPRCVRKVWALGLFESGNAHLTQPQKTSIPVVIVKATIAYLRRVK